MRYVWTGEEIESCPMWGDDVGWFYGLVRHKWWVVPAEVLPGMGYTIGWVWRDLFTALQDVRYTPRRKKKYVGLRSPGQQEEDLREMNDPANWVTLEEFMADLGVDADQLPPSFQTKERK